MAANPPQPAVSARVDATLPTPAVKEQVVLSTTELTELQPLPSNWRQRGIEVEIIQPELLSSLGKTAGSLQHFFTEYLLYCGFKLKGNRTIPGYPSPAPGA